MALERCICGGLSPCVCGHHVPESTFGEDVPARAGRPAAARGSRLSATASSLEDVSGQQQDLNGNSCEVASDTNSEHTQTIHQGSQHDVSAAVPDAGAAAPPPRSLRSRLATLPTIGKHDPPLKPDRDAQQHAAFIFEGQRLTQQPHRRGAQISVADEDAHEIHAAVDATFSSEDTTLTAAYCQLELTRELVDACANGELTGVRTLLDDDDLEVDVCAEALDGRTPLSAAAAAGRSDVVGLLLARGANVDTFDLEGRTPFWHACANGCDHVAALLLDVGASAAPVTVTAAPSPLAIAVANGHDGVVALLLDRAADRARSGRIGTAAEDLHQMVGDALVAYAAHTDQGDIACALERYLDDEWLSKPARCKENGKEQGDCLYRPHRAGARAAMEAAEAGATAAANAAYEKANADDAEAPEVAYDPVSGLDARGTAAWLQVPPWLTDEGGPKGVVTDAILERVKLELSLPGQPPVVGKPNPRSGPKPRKEKLDAVEGDEVLLVARKAFDSEVSALEGKRRGRTPERFTDDWIEAKRTREA